VGKNPKVLRQCCKNVDGTVHGANVQQLLALWSSDSKERDDENRYLQVHRNI